MAIWGKMIGGALGFVFGGGPVGALMGAMAGHAYDTGEAALRNGMNGGAAGGFGAGLRFGGRAPSGFGGSFGGEPGMDPYTAGVVVLGAKLAKADGRVTRVEIDTFKRVFAISPQQEAGIGALFDRARRSVDGFEPYAFQLAQYFRNQPVMLENILHGLFLIAAADNINLSPTEDRFLKTVAFIFNFTPDRFAAIAVRAQVRLGGAGGSGGYSGRPQVETLTPAPYLVLGITDKATNDEIKVAYRQLIRVNHPDKLASDGAAPNFIAAANEKMKGINAAYDAVCRLRGIK